PQRRITSTPEDTLYDADLFGTDHVWVVLTIRRDLARDVIVPHSWFNLIISPFFSLLNPSKHNFLCQNEADIYKN
ncbi:hypothetical protein BgiBS90_033784, partial [Biomphalaria glabrata]